MKFRLEIDCGNAAFGDAADPTHYRSDRADEIAKCLGDVAAWIERHVLEMSGIIRDTNGNRVGEWKIEGE